MADAEVDDGMGWDVTRDDDGRRLVGCGLYLPRLLWAVGCGLWHSRPRYQWTGPWGKGRRYPGTGRVGADWPEALYSPTSIGPPDNVASKAGTYLDNGTALFPCLGCLFLHCTAVSRSAASRHKSQVTSGEKHESGWRTRVESYQTPGTTVTCLLSPSPVSLQYHMLFFLFPSFPSSCRLAVVSGYIRRGPYVFSHGDPWNAPSIMVVWSVTLFAIY
ncbi:hypothetical protein EDB80DRAFT_680193 [Ilyonectria destructans]|nr:hypothetical protein EDB80DRAFT_680193 [Ilyonectria destructans]